MPYELTYLQPRDKHIELRGRTDGMTEHDQIRVEETTGEITAQPKALVDYTLTITVGGWKGYFIRLISADLEELCTESLEGLVKTCEAKWKAGAS